MIELFKQPNIDWMGKAKYFFLLSGLLLALGWAAILLKGGIKYGIDFRGGTNVDVRFAQPPNIDRLRSALQAQGLGNSEIQSISDIANANSNEVMIFVEQTGQKDQALDEGKAKVLTALNATYGNSNAARPDFNSITPTALGNFLAQRDPLGLSVNAGDKYQQLARALLAYRDKESNGVLSNFDGLANASGATPAVVSAIKDSFSLAPFAIRNVEIVGPKVGGELRNQAIRVTL
jgi:preprotein translocase subunit SecF